MDYLFATRAESGELGDPPVSARDKLGETRENELECAIQTRLRSHIKLLNFHFCQVIDTQERPLV